MTEHLSPDEMALLAMSPEDDTQRVAFVSHASSCEACGEQWHRAERLARLLSSLATPPAPSPTSLARTQARVHALMAAEPRALVLASPNAHMNAFAVAGAVLVSVVVALSLSGPAISASRMVVALATIGVAALLPSLALRSPRSAIGVSGLALSLSMALGWLDYSEYPLIAGHAAGCMEMEMAIAALPLLAMLGLSRSAGTRMSALQTAAAGACGALAGQGVLLTSCAADASVLHVLLYHVAGVALMAALGGGLGTLVARRAT